MLKLIEITLMLAAGYSAVAYAYLFARSVAKGEDWENETFHLGLCFILAVGFLGLILTQGG